MSLDVFPLFPGVPGGMELAVILLIAILLFGANKIPKLARSTGEAMGEFKKGRQAVEQELEEMRDTATLEEDELEGSEPAGTPAQPSSEGADTSAEAAETSTGTEETEATADEAEREQQ